MIAMNQVFHNEFNFETCELTPKVIDKVSFSIAKEWRSFGRRLGLTEEDLEHIGSDNETIHDKAANVVTKWIQRNKNVFWGNLKKELKSFKRLDVIKIIEKVFLNQSFSAGKNNNVRRIPRGCIFIFDLHEDECCTKVELQLHHEHDNWKSISNKKSRFGYYFTKNRNNKMYIKVENLIYRNDRINFRFSFKDLKDTCSQKHFFDVVITDSCRYVINYNDIIITTPEPIFENDLSIIRNASNNLDWRNTQKIHFDKVSCDKSLEKIALEYLDRNFSDCRDLIYFLPSITEEENFTFIASKFYELFADNRTGICAILPGYCLHYHAKLLNCTNLSFRNCNDENRIIIFYSELNLVFIVRVATSFECIKLESENCLNDIILYVSINKPLIEDKQLIILGIVVSPSFERKILKEDFFFQFSECFDLDQILFLCKDDLEDENLCCWWSSVVEYCIKKTNTENSNHIIFKQLIGLAMVAMAKVDHCFPTLESDTQKQIKSLILNVEQRNAINDKELKKIITGGYGSGKSVVGKEIVKNCISKMSANPITLYYICCNHFSLFECEMRRFVDNIEKTSNVTVVCDNLFELWKNMSNNENVSEKYISIPKLLKYLASTHSNQVFFVLEELSEEHVKEEDADQIKSLFTTLLKESLVVFIPESITKNRELIKNNQRCLLQRNCFQKEIIGMKVISLDKSMRVTQSTKFLLDSSQETICKSKTVYSVSEININSKILESEEPFIQNQQYEINTKYHIPKQLASNENYFAVESFTTYNSDNLSKKISSSIINTTNFHDLDLDHMAKIIAKNNKNIDPSSCIETEYSFKSCIIGHSIKGEKPKVIYLPFHDITEKRSAKLLSVVLENLCFKVLRKTVVICNNMEEIQSVSYAVDIIVDIKRKYRAVTYSPHLQKYSPSLKGKIEIEKKLRSDFDILITDCKGFSGAESESVIVLANPDEIYLRHVLVDAMARSNSHLTVLVLSSNSEEALHKDRTIGNVLQNWSEDIIDKIIVKCDEEEQTWKTVDSSLIINEHCKKFIDRGVEIDFDKYKEKLQFKVFHENNSIYNTMAFDLSKKAQKEFSEDSIGEIFKEIIACFATNFEKSMLEAGKRLNNDEVKVMKFLFSDLIDFSVLESITNGSEMMCVLKQIIENDPKEYEDFLEVLKTLERHDLVNMFSSQQTQPGFENTIFKRVHREDRSKSTQFNALNSRTTLNDGETLNEENYLSSGNGYYAILQGDGNFVLYFTRHWVAKNAIWSSRTCNKGVSPRRVIMQNDGNLVIYDVYNKVTWASGTSRKGTKPHCLVMQADGNLVIYDGNQKPTWSTGTDRS